MNIKTWKIILIPLLAKPLQRLSVSNTLAVQQPQCNSTKLLSFKNNKGFGSEKKNFNGSAKINTKMYAFIFSIDYAMNF